MTILKISDIMIWAVNVFFLGAFTLAAFEVAREKATAGNVLWFSVFAMLLIVSLVGLGYSIWL